MDIKTFVSCMEFFKDQRISVLIRGKHGIGKSDIVRQFANKIGVEYIDRRLSQMSEGDIIGLPKLEDGVTRFYPAEFIMRACEGPVILFLDELNRATPEVIQAAFQLVLDRELNGNRLHDDTLVFAAVNNSAEYHVNEMDPALVDRFWVVDLEPTVEDWLDWAGKNGIHSDIIAFVKRTGGEALEQVSAAEAGKITPSRRSWERLSRVLTDAGLMDKPDDPRFWSICTGFVGIEVTNNFVSFCKTIERQVSVEEVLNSFLDVEPKIRKMSMDNLSGLCDRIVKWSETNTFTLEQARHFGGFFRMLPLELRMITWVEIVRPREGEPINAERIHAHIIEPLLEIWDQKPDPSIPAPDAMRDIVPITGAAMPVLADDDPRASMVKLVKEAQPKKDDVPQAVVDKVSAPSAKKKKAASRNARTGT